jgi:hypothetical protein
MDRELLQAAAGAVRAVWCVGWACAVVSLASCTTNFPAPRPGVAGVAVERAERGAPGRSLAAEADTVDLWVVADPLHTGLVAPLEWLEEHGFRTPEAVRGQRYINVSWGDRVAYEQARWLNAWEVCNAVLLPSESVVEIIGFHYKPRDVFPQQRLYRARVERWRGAGLAAFLNRCGGVEDGAPWRVVGPATWGRGSLMASPHRYGFPRLCNAFTANALEACGYRIGPWAEIWADALLDACRRQGFEPEPELSAAEVRAIIEYSKAHPQ